MDETLIENMKTISDKKRVSNYTHVECDTKAFLKPAGLNKLMTIIIIML